MYKRIIMIAVFLILVVVSSSALARVTAPDWSNFYGVVNIQRSGFYHFFEYSDAGMTGEERVASFANINGFGMPLVRTFDFTFSGDQFNGTVEDKNIEIGSQFKGIRSYDFTVTPSSIKGTIKSDYEPQVRTFDLTLQDNKLTGTQMNKKKVVLKYDVTFGDDGSITGTIGVKGNMHYVDLKLKDNILSGTIKGTKRFGNGNYQLEPNFAFPYTISRERVAFIFLVLIHQEFITDFNRNLDFDMFYHRSP